MAVKTTLKVALMLGGAVFLAGCDDTNLPAFLKNSDRSATTETALESKAGRTIERDVEAPEVFQISEKGLWDGRPSLGGVWVAHPEADDPERVIVRNQANGKFVIGALFRRERDIPGPRFQVSSDAAETLGMLAGAPVDLTVTALRKEVITEEPAPAPAPETGDLEAPADIKQESLEDPIAAAERALDEADASADAPKTAAASSPPAAKPAPPAPVSGLTKPFIQIGIFSVEQNAKNTSEAVRQAGMVPTIKPGKSNGKAFWRVVVGPATNSSERAALLKKIKALGFNDAYYVTN